MEQGLLCISLIMLQVVHSLNIVKYRELDVLKQGRATFGTCAQLSASFQHVSKTSKTKSSLANKKLPQNYLVKLSVCISILIYYKSVAIQPF